MPRRPRTSALRAVPAPTPTPRTPAGRLALDGARELLGWRSAVACSELEPGRPTTRRSPITSHLPHAIAAALGGDRPRRTALDPAAGAYRDGTRVAGCRRQHSGPPSSADNRAPLLKALGTLEERVAAFKYAVMTDDEDAIRQLADQCDTADVSSKPGNHANQDD